MHDPAQPRGDRVAGPSSPLPARRPEVQEAVQCAAQDAWNHPPRAGEPQVVLCLQVGTEGIRREGLQRFDGQEIVLGRRADSGADVGAKTKVFLRGSSTSRIHAKLKRDYFGEVWIEPHGQNGTHELQSDDSPGKKLPSNVRMQWRPNVRLMFGCNQKLQGVAPQSGPAFDIGWLEVTKAAPSACSPQGSKRPREVDHADVAAGAAAANGRSLEASGRCGQSWTNGHTGTHALSSAGAPARGVAPSGSGLPPLTLPRARLASAPAAVEGLGPPGADEDLEPKAKRRQQQGSQAAAAAAALAGRGAARPLLGPELPPSARAAASGLGAAARQGPAVAGAAAARRGPQGLNGLTNGLANGHGLAHSPAHDPAHGYANGLANGQANGHVNGHANGQVRRHPASASAAGAGGSATRSDYGHERNTINTKKCDKCDGTHPTEACPHFKQGRDKHKDAWVNYGRNHPLNIGQSGPKYILRSGRRVRQPGDGNCLFHALDFGLRRLQGTAGSAQLRRELASFIERNPQLEISGDTLEEWIRWDAQATVTQYARRMANTGWGGGIEMAACSLLKKVNVHVYEQKRQGEFERITCFDYPEGSKNTIHILYEGGMHYDAIVANCC